MSKKILVIGRRDSGEKNDARLLAEAIAQRSNFSVTGAYYEQVVFDIRQGSTTATIHDTSIVDVTDFDVLILINWSHKRLYTDIAHSIALLAKKAGKEIWNEELLDARSSTKLSQLVQLSDTDVIIPETLYSLSPELLQPLVGQLGEQFIAKDPLASRGRNNLLCASWDDFASQSDDTATYLFQQFIPNDKSDVRMFVLAMKPKLAILRRGSDESHLNNISAGGNAEILNLDTLPPKLLRDTEVIAQHFRRNLSGIDFMRNELTNDYVFLEINTTPQIVNGAFVEQKIDAFIDAIENKEK